MQAVICPAEKLVTITAQDFVVEQPVLEASGESKLGGSRVGKAGTLLYLARECLRDEVRVYKIDPGAAQPVTVQHRNVNSLVGSLAGRASSGSNPDDGGYRTAVHFGWLTENRPAGNHGVSADFCEPEFLLFVRIQDFRQFRSALCINKLRLS
jgi:hypothetical protein